MRYEDGANRFVYIKTKKMVRIIEMQYIHLNGTLDNLN